jgi:hypothetical protein
MCPEHDIRAFTGLSGSLELVGGSFGRFDLDRNSQIFFKLFADFGQPAVALIAVDPNQKFAIGPSER